MPTGSDHFVIRRENGPGAFWDEPCRCMIGHNHTPTGIVVQESDLERWDREEYRGSSDPNCPACSGTGACGLCGD